MDKFEERQRQDKIDRAKRVAEVTRPRAEAMAAARWWADTLRKPEPPDTGDSRNDGVMFALTTPDKFNETMISTFEAELAAGIEAELAERTERRAVYRDADPSYCWHWFLMISVDYHPDHLLFEAAERAELGNVDMMVFPCKTTMHIDRGKISVSHGYSAPNVVIWASDEGAAYWTSDAMVKCRDVMFGLANGLGGRNMVMAVDLLAQAVALDMNRPPGYDDELPVEATRGQRDLGAFITGLGIGVEFAVAARVVQMRKTPEAEAPGAVADEEASPFTEESEAAAAPG